MKKNSLIKKADEHMETAVLDKLDDFGFDTENFRELLNFLTERMK